MKLPKIVFGKDRIFKVDPTPHEKLLAASELVDQAVNGTFPFCHAKVPKIYKSECFEINNEIARLKTINLVCADELPARKARERIKILKKKKKDLVVFDVVAYKKLLSNFKKLDRALGLLLKHDRIKSCTLLANGYLKITADFEASQVVVIEQNIKFNYEYEPVVKTKTQMDKEYQNDKLFCREFDPDRITEQGKVIPIVEEQIDSQGGGIDPVNYVHRQSKEPTIKELTEFNALFKDLTVSQVEDKIVSFLATLIYLKEKYNGN